MGAQADRDLHESLTKIIDQLERAAEDGLKLPPDVTRLVAKGLRVTRDCHKHLAAYERDISALDNVYPLHGYSIKVPDSA